MIVRLHDRYVLRAFWGTFAGVLAFFTVVTVVIHLVERLARLLRHWEGLREAGEDPLGAVVRFYATLLPFVWIQIVPLAAVLAATIALTRLTRHNELAPLVTAGVSTRRLTLPILLSGALLAGGILWLQEALVPSLSREHVRLSRLLSRSDPDRVTDVPHFRDPGGARLSMAAFLPIRQRVEGALLTLRDAQERVREMRWYPELAWDAPARRWTAPRGGTLLPVAEDPSGATRRQLPASAAVPLQADVRLLEVSVSQGTALGLASSETAALVAANPDDPRLVVMHHQLFTRPLSALVLLLLGLPLGFGLGRRSAIPGLAGVLAVSTLYYASSFAVSALSGGGDVNPAVLAWLPTVLFGSLGLALWFGMDS